MGMFQRGMFSIGSKGVLGYVPKVCSKGMFQRYVPDRVKRVPEEKVVCEYAKHGT